VLGATGGYGVGKALSTVLLYVIEALTGRDLPGEIRLAAEVLIEAAALFAGAYFISPSLDDTVIPSVQEVAAPAPLADDGAGARTG
jgi:hypothetical protein